MDYFWDYQTNFMKKYCENYLEEKDKIMLNPTNSQKKLEQLKSEFREEMIESLGKDIPNIEEEHLKLSLAFGFPLGISGTLKPQDCEIRSILDYCANSLDFIRKGLFPPENYKASVFSSNLFIFLTVFYVIIDYMKIG